MTQKVFYQVGYKTKFGWLAYAIADTAADARALLKIRIKEMGETIPSLNAQAKYVQETITR